MTDLSNFESTFPWPCDGYQRLTKDNVLFSDYLDFPDSGPGLQTLNSLMHIPSITALSKDYLSTIGANKSFLHSLPPGLSFSSLLGSTSGPGYRYPESVNTHLIPRGLLFVGVSYRMLAFWRAANESYTSAVFPLIVDIYSANICLPQHEKLKPVTPRHTLHLSKA